MGRDTMPTHTDGVFPFFKDKEMTMYSTIIRQRQGLGGWMEGETFYSTRLLSLIRRIKQLSFFVSVLNS